MRIIEAKLETLPKGHKILHNGQDYNFRLKLLVDEIPKLTYRRIELDGTIYFYGEQEGYCDIYEYRPNSTGSFGGCPITLNIENCGQSTFTGCLWDPSRLHPLLPWTVSVAITTEPEVMQQGYTFIAGKITNKLFGEILNGLKPDQVEGEEML